ncbi:hypothetical protein ACFV2U_21125 [Streptomyces sp. NPDC059697]|uniref:hypothetical protein n=1 Tax=Streptomyces sp. NPDC059697 TaxID=3346912 RepID=UPI00367A0518
MRTRAINALAPVLLACGISGALTGLVFNYQRIIWAGSIVLGLGALAVLRQTILHAHRATDAQLAAAEVNGYRKALAHVATGLLDNGTTPTPGPGEPTPADNVVRLRPPNGTAVNRPQRKAQ